MVLDEAGLRQAESRFGTPRELQLEAVLDEREMELVAGSLRKLRSHDITLFIVEGDELVVIRKPFFPPGAYRAPSGGAHRGETFEQGAVREALEETGLTVALDRYLLRVHATFRPRRPWAGAGSLPAAVVDPSDPSTLHWTTHVVSAHPTDGLTPDPIDTHEIAEARWAPFAELQGPIRDTLLTTGQALFAYRVQLTDATVALLDFSTGAGDTAPWSEKQNHALADAGLPRPASTERRR